ncbi:MAG: ABC transporter ATP-binding protein [Proteobacteria bacterium]|nr:ABC transporter ATP-binding protein [Pseudomonadota bacterium]MDA1356714.1 ABC transporter ATP-binding protein [Pseudomonadota bacterium]
MTVNAAAPGLLLAGVSHRYGHEPVLRGLDLEIARGEITCLLGPSGCGKSTSLRVAAGLEPIQEGRVEIAGVEVARPGFSVPPERRRVGLMFQDYALFPHLRVVDNVAFGVREGDKAAKRRAAMELLARLGVERYAKDFPHVLSGGEQQRVALARALAPRPVVMLLDEPFSGLDRRLRDRVRTDTLDVLRELSVATLLVTHDSEEAMLMSDRIALMRDGAIVQSGTAAELYSRPESAFAASFFGEVNVIEGTAQGGAVATSMGTLAAPFKDGCQVRVFIRPEGLNLDAELGDQAAGAVAEIVASHMLGPSWLVRLKLAGNIEPLTARVNEGGLWKTGKTVRIRLDPERSFVFPASQEM